MCCFCAASDFLSSGRFALRVGCLFLWCCQRRSVRGLQLLVCGRGCFHRDLGLVLQTARSPEKQLLLMVNYILIANSASHYFTLQVLNSKPMFTPTKLLSRLHVDTWVGSGFMCQSLCPGCRLGGAMELSSTCFFMGSTTLWCVRGWWAWLVDV